MILGAAAASSGCKRATGLGAGSLSAAAPVLIHEPMGIERVRFRYRETGTDFEYQQALLETAASGTTTRGTATGQKYLVTTTSITRTADITARGFESLSPRSWAANVHVDASRWTFFPLIFAVGRAYVEAQGDVVDVGVQP